MSSKRRLSTTRETRILSLDRLRALLKQEENEAYQVPHSYIPDEYSDRTVETYAKWRFAMIQWFQDLFYTFEYQQDTLEVTISILDRYVAAKPQLMKNSKEYKMAAITSLYIAAKIHEPQCLSPDDAYDLSYEIQTAEKTLEEEELDILQTIEWRVNPPTPSAVLSELLALIPSDLMPKEEIQGKVRRQLDIMLREEVFCAEKPSMLVLGALYNSVSSMHKAVEIRLFGALEIEDYEQATKYIERLQSLINTVSRMRGFTEEEDYETEDEDEHDAPCPPPKEDNFSEQSSPRSTATKSIC